MEKNKKYIKYIGNYAKRFYAPFEKQNIAKIINFKTLNNIPYFQMQDDSGKKWYWDVEDCVIITNEFPPPIADEINVANIYNIDYNGFNPYNK